MRFAHDLVGVTLRDRMRSEDIREQVKMIRIDKDNLKGLDNRVPKITMNYKPTGLRNLEQPRSCWQEQF
jgi:hypothetical protein